MLVCEQQIETRVSSKTSMNSRAIIYSMKRRKKKEVSIACIHIQTCKHTQYAYNNAHTRRLMFIDITIIFVKQCITNWKSLDIFTFYLSGFWREFFFSSAAHIFVQNKLFLHFVCALFVSSFVFYEKFTHDCWLRRKKNAPRTHNKYMCAPLNELMWKRVRNCLNIFNWPFIVQSFWLHT